MGMRETMLTKLMQATCDKPDLDRRFLRIWRSLQAVEKVIEGGGKDDGKKSCGRAGSGRRIR